MVPRENKNNADTKFGGTNKEYSGIFQNGLYLKHNHYKNIISKNKHSQPLT